jgi:type IV pilus assembly protein PilQ
MTHAALALGALVALPGTAAAKATGSVVVERIETRHAEFGREVVIHTSKEPTFSVFRLSEPFRVLVDVNDARMDRDIGLMKVRDGVIRYISTNQFADETSAILRVEIALEDAAPYSLRTEGSSILVMIGSDQKKLDEAAPAPVSEPAVEPKAEVVEPKAEAAPVQMGKLTKHGSALHIPVLSGALAEGGVRIEELEYPSRLVIDFANAAIQPKWQRVDVKSLGVRRARVATHEGGVRIVLDGMPGKSLPKVDVTQTGDHIEVALSRAVVETPVAAAPGAPGEPAVLVETKPQPIEQAPIVDEVVEAEVAELPAKAPSKEARVEDVTFEPKDGFMRLTMFFDGDVEVSKEASNSASAPVIRIPNANLPKNLERTLDVSEVAGSVVTSVSTYRQGSDVLIAAAIGDSTEHRHWVKGNRVMWDFRNPGDTNVITYPEQATSGYAAATAIQAIGEVAPEARRYKGRRISLDLKDAEIQNVLRLLADVSKLNIVASDDVKGRVTIKLRNVPWDQALDIILRSKQLDKVRNGNIIRVAPIETLRKEEELRLERQKAKIELEPLAVRLIPVSYAVANEVKPQVLALLSPRGKVNIDVRTNVLIVEDIAEVLLKVERLVRTLDTQTPQVLIEARIVEARANFQRELGIQWGGQVNATQQYGTQTGLTFPSDIRIAGGADDPQNNVTDGVLPNPNWAINLPAVVGNGGGGALGFVFGSVGGASLINLRLSAAEATGKVKVISAPKVVTLDNKEAKILSGERVPITVITANGPTTRFIDANLELLVTPHVTQDGSVLIKIMAANNQLSNRVDLLGVPGIITREAVTEMIVGDGDTAVLGGIYQRQTQENESYVPWIGKIPVLGWIFKTTSRTDARDELLIFISPRIINRSAALVNAG